MSARVVVLTRPGCHLCEDACAVVARVATDTGVGWQAKDITGDDELTSRWGEYIPVVIVDGEVHDWFRVDESRLRAALG
jgi:hypothetical protein